MLRNAMNEFAQYLQQYGNTLPFQGSNSNTLSIMECDRLYREFTQAVHAGHDMDQYRPILERFYRQVSVCEVIPTNGSEWKAVQRAFNPDRLGRCLGFREAHVPDYQRWEWVQQKNWLNRLLSLQQQQKVRTLTQSEMEELDQVKSPKRYPFEPNELFEDIKQGVREIFNELARNNQ